MDAGFSAWPWFKWVVILGFGRCLLALCQPDLFRNAAMTQDASCVVAHCSLGNGCLVCWGALTPMIVQLGRTLRRPGFMAALSIVHIGADIIFPPSMLPRVLLHDVNSTLDVSVILDRFGTNSLIR